MPKQGNIFSVGNCAHLTECYGNIMHFFDVGAIFMIHFLWKTRCVQFSLILKLYCHFKNHRLALSTWQLFGEQKVL